MFVLYQHIAIIASCHVRLQKTDMKETFCYFTLLCSVHYQNTIYNRINSDLR